MGTTLPCSNGPTLPLQSRSPLPSNAPWLLVLAIASSTVLHAVPAYAQAARTYVSGSGLDGNPCTTDLPCKTLQAALGKTVAGGQIYALDSADYGYVTINKAVSIIGADGAAGILAPSSVTGITIGAAANDVINLQGLDIDGSGTGTNGILFQTGASLHIKDSEIRGFA